ncbi:FG-GAP repeat protein [Hymenobacter guriensis]|uniref:FG-GAP repeat protein n=1 Tax=Hymenobacter guriensis TaxID=2793065 RepID=A0ABS0L5D5_9BACT|nr:FG-GAP repeat protein [Hymenobacter guriensis]MBG8555337.1 FG-GAP repeat protein [Hymenobacter guriensis]
MIPFTLLLYLPLLVSKPPHTAFPAWAQVQWQQQKLEQTFSRNNYLRTALLQADFNGDGKVDVAIPVVWRATGSQGVIIFHQGQAAPFMIGTTSNPTDELPKGNLAWANQWKLFTKQKTYEVYLDKQETLRERPVTLRYPAIEFSDGEKGGVLYWTGTRYRWLYQSC